MMEKMRSTALVSLASLGIVTGCGDWVWFSGQSSVLINEDGLINGAVVDPAIWLRTFKEAEGNRVMDDVMKDAAGIPNVTVCVVDMPDLCSVSDEKGNYEILPTEQRDGYVLVATPPAQDDFLETIRPIGATYGAVDYMMFVVRGRSILNAAAIAAGLANEGDADAYLKIVERGGGVVVSEPRIINDTTTDFKFGTIEIDVTGAVSSVWALDLDASGSFIAFDAETADPDMAYPLSAGVYIGDGTEGDLGVTVYDKAKSLFNAYDPDGEGLPYAYHWNNKPGTVYLYAAPVTKNAIHRAHTTR
jgi:hypothetical protein